MDSRTGCMDSINLDLLRETLFLLRQLELCYRHHLLLKNANICICIWYFFSCITCSVVRYSDGFKSIAMISRTCKIFRMSSHLEAEDDGYMRIFQVKGLLCRLKDAGLYILLMDVARLPRQANLFQQAQLCCRCCGGIPSELSSYALST